jgi:RimJ/RimL family protein N-acetyltransferase
MSRCILRVVDVLSGRKDQLARCRSERLETMKDLSAWTGCPAPEPFAMEGCHIALVPFDGDAHVAALWEALGGSAGINERLRYFPNPPYRSPDAFGAWLAAAQGDWLTSVFLDVRSRAVVGMASYMRIDAANGSIEVGSVAHGDAMARSPLATEAHYLLARHVFEDLGYRRYEWKCHNENAPSKRTAERLGFTFEGIFRQHIVSKGANRDTAWYSIIDREWPAIGRAMATWLAPDNFDAAGRQRVRLETIRAQGRNESGQEAGN